ncbi:hypothetical protein HDU85_000086 [Gaertneriomyces sp. JEL0708]|nr:hypothetical protein HDU85_000086 [Gaertneriomyces sp. JEL0708]
MLDLNNASLPTLQHRGRLQQHMALNRNTAASSADDEVYLPSRLTIILTTSPTPSNPSTALISTVLDSLNNACFSSKPTAPISKCPLIVTFDGYVEHAATSKLKSGRVVADLAERYEEYIAKVQEELTERSQQLHGKTFEMINQEEQVRLSASTWCTAEIRSLLCLDKATTADVSAPFALRLIRMRNHAGFALCVRTALSLVTTPFVLVLQHDWAFVQKIDFAGLVRHMECHDQMNYVGFLSTRILEYVKRKGRGKGLPPCIFDSPSWPLVRLYFWFDKPHLARTNHYRTNVFSRGFFKKGDFIEDTYGQYELKCIKEAGLKGDAEGIAEWEQFGTFLYYPDDGKYRALTHLHGRAMGTGQGRRAGVSGFKELLGTKPANAPETPKYNVM